MTTPEHLRGFSDVVATGHPMILLGAVQAAVAEGALPPGSGPGLVPIIMGTLVLAPMLLSALSEAHLRPAFLDAMTAAARADLYRLLGYTP